MIKTCWSNRTPFETILILILMVAVPFFVTMIILYLSFIGSYPSESCFKMCKMLSFLLEEDYNKPKEWANEKEKKERWVVGPENFTGEGMFRLY
nr:PREDICTED: uncharacterized protein LOC107398312 isoform X2 [Tribolium castaneum]|eukprot:XP_015837499.1 PREDICTED: uncharacterized protein LOC107398312 isoform X2 [Tribolium castaneum]